MNCHALSKEMVKSKETYNSSMKTFNFVNIALILILKKYTKIQTK